MKKTILAISGLILLTVFIGYELRLPKAEAKGIGKCAIPELREAKKEATAIFIGEVLSVSQKGDYKFYEIRVEKYWKGKVKKRVTVGYYEGLRTEGWYEKGEKYLFFVKADEKGKLMDYRCSRTKNIVDSKEDISKLGKAKRVR